MFRQVVQYVNSIFEVEPNSVWPEIIVLLLIVVAAGISFFVADWIMSRVAKIVARTATTWDDDLLNVRMQQALSLAAPVVLVCWSIAGFQPFFPLWGWMTVLNRLIVLAAVVWVLCVLVSNLYEAFFRRPKLRTYAVKGVFQMVKLVIIAIAIITAVSIIIHRSPVTIFTAIGATAGVMMFVFKDTFLGLVASIQLTANDMIHRGDWIVCDKYGANGEVLDISLTIIKVKNWDNSITTIPPYALVSDSFRNYQPMRNSGGRRVERSILIDANTVRFCNTTELEGLRERGWLEGLDIDQAGRHVNIYLLRSYLEHWLGSDPRVNHDMLMMVRQMAPTSTGLPLNLYFFCNEVDWKAFERVQSDIFDHVYAVIAEFGLRVYQLPTDGTQR